MLLLRLPHVHHLSSGICAALWLLTQAGKTDAIHSRAPAGQMRGWLKPSLKHRRSLQVVQLAPVSRQDDSTMAHL